MICNKLLLWTDNQLCRLANNVEHIDRGHAQVGPRLPNCLFRWGPGRVDPCNHALTPPDEYGGSIFVHLCDMKTIFTGIVDCERSEIVLVRTPRLGVYARWRWLIAATAALVTGGG